MPEAESLASKTAPAQLAPGRGRFFALPQDPYGKGVEIVREAKALAVAVERVRRLRRWKLGR
jgi:hypothetical protein